MQHKSLEQIHSIIQELKEDHSIPRNVIMKLEAMENLFSNGGDIHINVDKALQVVEEIIESNNLQPFIRTRLWNISSLLESI